MAGVLKPGRYLFDGIKGISLDDLDTRPGGWTYLSGGPSGTEGVEKYYKAVPWLFRAVQLRSQALSSLPFAILSKGGETLDSSDDYQNKAKIIPDPVGLLYLVEASLVLTGRCYLSRIANTVKTTGLRYLLPTSITPIVTEEKGLVGFKRQLGTTTLELKVDDLIYFWTPNPWSEAGPGVAPAEVAMLACGVLFNVDEFASIFFKRGLVKATLLTVEGTVLPGVLDQLKAWWKRQFSGMQNAWNTGIFNAAVTPVVIGDGIKELENVTLTREKKEDICTAFGIPQTLLFADAANYATASQDDLHFYSKTIVPEADKIAGILNEQLFEPLGMQWVFRPETLDVFQEDENQRATAVATYVGAGMPLKIAAQMLGVELPEGVTWEDLEPEPVPEALAPFAGPGQPSSLLPPGFGKPEQQKPAMRADLGKWKRAALKRLKEGKAALFMPFETDAIPDAIYEAIQNGLATATTPEEVKAAFAAPFCNRGADVWQGYP